MATVWAYIEGDIYTCRIYGVNGLPGDYVPDWTVGDVIPVIYGLNGEPDVPGPWVIRRVWYEHEDDGRWCMEAERGTNQTNN